jgi:hypothetical protein
VRQGTLNCGAHLARLQLAVLGSRGAPPVSLQTPRPQDLRAPGHKGGIGIPRPWVRHRTDRRFSKADDSNRIPTSHVIRFERNGREPTDDARINLQCSAGAPAFEVATDVRASTGVGSSHD